MPSSCFTTWPFHRAVGYLLTLLIAAGAFRMAIATETEEKPKNKYTSEQLQPYLNATEWILYSLDPDPWLLNEGGDPFSAPAAPPGSEGAKKAETNPETPEKPKRKVPPDQEFHEYPILGQLVMKENEKLRYVIQALDTAGQNWVGVVAACYSPRHGIRVKNEGKIHDLVICYECSIAALYVDGKNVGRIYFGTYPRYTATPYPLDGILRKAGIKRAPGR